MKHTRTKLLYHCIFSTENRRAFITEDIRDRLHGYMGGILRERGATLVVAGSIDDHIHLLVELPPAMSVAEAMRLVKANSSKWLRETFHGRATFAWQTGYAAFSVSASACAEVVRYIENQRGHHGQRGFDDEMAAFLRRHGVQDEPAQVSA